jgi:hypothetical protein
LHAIFAPGLTVDDVAVLIDRFLYKAARSRLDPFIRLGQTIRKHRDGILHAIHLGINHGRTEALNNKVRLITRRALRQGGARARDAHLRTDHFLATTRTTPMRRRFTYIHAERAPICHQPVSAGGTLGDHLQAGEPGMCVVPSRERTATDPRRLSHKTTCDPSLAQQRFRAEQPVT